MGAWLLKDEGNAVSHDKPPRKLTGQHVPAMPTNFTYHPCSSLNNLYSAVLVIDHAMTHLSGMLLFHGELSGVNVIPEVLCWVTNPGVQHPPPSAVVEDLAASLGKELISKLID
jgi:hypothetical protein